MTAVDLSSFAGLSAMVLLTVNILLGLLISIRYNPIRSWPHRRLPLFQVHNWTAYIALGLVFAHPILLLFSKTAGFHIVDVLWPLSSPQQRLYNCLAPVRCTLFRSSSSPRTFASTSAGRYGKPFTMPPTRRQDYCSCTGC